MKKKVLAMEAIQAAQVVTVDGECLFAANPQESSALCGLALRDIQRGENVEYDPSGNTKDIAVRDNISLPPSSKPSDFYL